ncbi:MAG: hypothetical protein HYS73_00005, partial [Parcubacteria group bacterium]|nr:hypothetical protein [Parcubacteria group bacterium]MBI2049245.1 hypothetical protein [Parcubacteria group bacterium]
MKRGKILGAVIAFLFLLLSVFVPSVSVFGAGNLAGDTESDYALNVSRKCEEPSRYNEFRKNRILFSWANKAHPRG